VIGQWVVFDLIGVLAEPSWREIAPLDASKWRSFKLGGLAEAAFWDAAHAAAYRKVLSFRSDRLAYVKRLKERGYKICVATNFSGEWLGDLLSKSGASMLFDARVVSAEVKVGKPEPAFFVEVLRHVPGGSIFVDDQKSNCDAAARAGLRVVFAHPGRAVEDEVERLLREAPPSR
jgi:HAD superfamily hydrolase (TIGR01509 family)